MTSDEHKKMWNILGSVRQHLFIIIKMVIEVYLNTFQNKNLF